jgi:hypothetical protein
LKRDESGGEEIFLVEKKVVNKGSYKLRAALEKAAR